MSSIMPDTLYGKEVPLALGETTLVEWRTSPSVYWRNHAAIAFVGGIVAGAILLALGNPDPWVGPVAAVAAVAVRAAFLASEAFRLRWRLTDRRLLGPSGQAIPLTLVKVARPFFGDVQVVTVNGEKHLMKYMANPQAVITAIADARYAFAARAKGQ